jgi:tRNA threonylcarbamoyladenosine biosynthesis protein TsaE
MQVETEQDMIKLGERLAGAIKAPCLIELVGDVGAGKTTLVKGLARGLGIGDDVTSPSFTINKRYEGDTVLSHYDFYRLEDAGIMKNEIDESLGEQNTIVVVEWAGAVQDILPGGRTKVNISYCADGSRKVEIQGANL